MNHLVFKAAMGIVTENCHCLSNVIFKSCKAMVWLTVPAMLIDSRDTLAERFKAVAQGTIPKGRGFEPHKCHFVGVAAVCNTASHDAFVVGPGIERTLFDQCKLVCRSVECQLVPTGNNWYQYLTVPYGAVRCWYQLVPTGTSWYQLVPTAWQLRTWVS